MKNKLEIVGALIKIAAYTIVYAFSLLVIFSYFIVPFYNEINKIPETSIQQKTITNVFFLIKIISSYSFIKKKYAKGFLLSVAGGIYYMFAGLLNHKLIISSDVIFLGFFDFLIFFPLILIEKAFILRAEK